MKFDRSTCPGRGIFESGIGWSDRVTRAWLRSHARDTQGEYEAITAKHVTLAGTCNYSAILQPGDCVL